MWRTHAPPMGYGYVKLPPPPNSHSVGTLRCRVGDLRWARRTDRTTTVTGKMVGPFYPVIAYRLDRWCCQPDDERLTVVSLTSTALYIGDNTVCWGSSVNIVKRHRVFSWFSRERRKFTAHLWYSVRGQTTKMALTSIQRILVRMPFAHTSKRQITSKAVQAMLGPRPSKPAPFPYLEKDYNFPFCLFDKTTSRFDENTKLILLEGPVGVG